MIWCGQCMLHEPLIRCPSNSSYPGQQFCKKPFSNGANWFWKCVSPSRNYQAIIITIVRRSKPICKSRKPIFKWRGISCIARWVRAIYKWLRHLVIVRQRSAILKSRWLGESAWQLDTVKVINTLWLKLKVILLVCFLTTEKVVTVLTRSNVSPFWFVTVLTWYP